MIISVMVLYVSVGYSSVRYFRDLIPDVSLAISISENIDSIYVLSFLLCVFLSHCAKEIYLQNICRGYSTTPENLRKL